MKYFTLIVTLLIALLLVGNARPINKVGKESIIKKNKHKMINPQPEPPGKYKMINPQPEPPGKYKKINPQPEPPGKIREQ